MKKKDDEYWKQVFKNDPNLYCYVKESNKKLKNLYYLHSQSIALENVENVCILGNGYYLIKKQGERVGLYRFVFDRLELIAFDVEFADVFPDGSFCYFVFTDDGCYCILRDENMLYLKIDQVSRRNMPDICWL